MINHSAGPGHCIRTMTIFAVGGIPGLLMVGVGGLVVLILVAADALLGCAGVLLTLSVQAIPSKPMV